MTNKQIATALGVSERTVEQDNVFNSRPERFADRVRNIQRLLAEQGDAVQELKMAVAQCAQHFPTEAEVEAILSAVRDAGWDPPEHYPVLKPLEQVLGMHNQLRAFAANGEEQ